MKKKIQLLDFLNISALLFCSIALTACQLNAANKNGTSPASDKSKLPETKKVEVVDQNAGITLLTLTVPAQWSVKSATNWNAAESYVKYEVHCVSPDGKEGFSIYPYTFSSAMQNLPNFNIEMFAERVVLPNYTKYDDAEVVAKGSKPIGQQQVGNMHSVSEIDSMLITYTREGEKYCDILVGLAKTIKTNMMGMDFTGYSLQIYGYTQKAAPVNKVMDAFVSIFNSIKVNPQWSLVSNNFIAENSKRNDQRMNDNTQRQIATQNEIARQNMEVFNQRNQANSDYMRRQTNILTDRQDVTDPYTGQTYKTTNQYDNTYINNQNQILHTNSNQNPNENPELNSGGREWKKVKPR